MANRTLRVGYSAYPTWWQPCAFEKPMTCKYPGASMETMLLLEKYYDAKFDFIYSQGFGVGAPTEKDSVCRSVMNGTVQMGPTLLYIAERLANLPNYSFPINSIGLGALIKANSSLIRIGGTDTMTLSTQAPIWALLIVIGMYLYFVSLGMESTKKTSFAIAKLALKLNTHVVSMTVLFYVSFMATTIAVTLFQANPKHYPFHTFDKMADAVLEGRVKIVGLDAAAPSRFVTPGIEIAEVDETMMKFYKANEMGDRIRMVRTVAEALELVESGEWIYVSLLQALESIPDFCNYEIINDPSFPNTPYGLVVNNVTPAWFRTDAPLMQSAGIFFQHYIKSYLRPTQCVKERKREQLSLSHTLSMFYLFWGGCCFGGIALLWEICHAKTAKRFACITKVSDGSNDSLQVRLKQLAAEYRVTTIIEGIYEPRGDVWVCHTPKQ